MTAQHLILNVSAWVCVGIAGWALVIAWMNRLMMMRFYGASRYQTCHAVTWLLGTQARRIRTLAFMKWACIVVGVYGLIRHFESSPSPFGTIGGSLGYAVLLLIGCVQFFGQERPAAVLLLGACQETTLRLHARLRNAAWPHRVVSLLETGDVRSQNINAGDCFRITLGNWEPAISRLIRCCIIVVVDHRVITPAVSHELREIIKQGAQFKTILIGQSLRSNLQPELSSCLQLNSEDACCALLKRVLSGTMVLASDIQPISSLAEED